MPPPRWGVPPQLHALHGSGGGLHRSFSLISDVGLHSHTSISLLLLLLLLLLQLLLLLLLRLLMLLLMLL
jgi:hypothetical protein